MARCNECIHKEICQFYNALGCKVLCQECGFFINTADVVPKSEVEKIFEEIEELINHHYYEWDFCYYDDELGEDFDELKKKYTESEDKG